jgi:hypothetical protein
MPEVLSDASGAALQKPGDRFVSRFSYCWVIVMLPREHPRVNENPFYGFPL